MRHNPAIPALLSLLARSGQTDLALARLLHTTVPTIGRWRRGQSTPHPLAIPALVAALQTAETVV